MTAPHDIVALHTSINEARGERPMPLHEWTRGVIRDPLSMVQTTARQWVDLHLANGQRVRVRQLPEARQWRPHNCDRFTALPDIRHLVPAATRGHRRVRVRLRNGRACYGDPSGFVWTSCGSATIIGWRPA